MTVYDTAIIGGGIQGMYQALRRTEQGENIIIVDPHEKPLQNWLKNTQNCGQKFMRSPYTHNLGRTENSLQYWRDTSQEPEENPSLRRFNGHSLDLIDLNLDKSSFRGRYIVTGIKPTSQEKSGKTNVHRITGLSSADNSDIYARKVVVAAGKMNGIHTPYIIEYQNREFYKHVFDAGFTPNFGLREDRPIVIIGGGITAIQTATMYAKRKEKLKHSHPVYLLSRSRIKHSERDADPKWADINTVKQYDEMNLERRLKVFNQTKNKGTVPGYALAEAMSQSNLRHIQTLPTRAQFKSNRQGINIETREGEKISNAYIICATGFSPQSHDTSWIKNRASTFRPNSNVSENGYPNLNKDLSWGGIETQGISFVGELGLSRLGPFHTNIRGAQLAWQRMRQGRKKFFSWW